jgi:hypothetical protein
MVLVHRASPVHVPSLIESSIRAEAARQSSYGAPEPIVVRSAAQA